MKYMMKLVRDRIPEKISENNEFCQYIQITDDEAFQQALLQKLFEECMELRDEVKLHHRLEALGADEKELVSQNIKETRARVLAEICDVQEVLDTIAETFNITKQEVATYQEEKRKLNGGFKDRIFLTVTDTEGDLRDLCGRIKISKELSDRFEGKEV